MFDCNNGESENPSRYAQNPHFFLFTSSRSPKFSPFNQNFLLITLKIIQSRQNLSLVFQIWRNSDSKFYPIFLYSHNSANILINSLKSLYFEEGRQQFEAGFLQIGFLKSTSYLPGITLCFRVSYQKKGSQHKLHKLWLLCTY